MADGQCVMHSQVRVAVLQRWPGMHPPSQIPPQPSLPPQGVVSRQSGVQMHVYDAGSHTAPACGQVPMQWPPQPSSAPHAPPAVQVRSHTHVPTTQWSRGERLHAGSQWQVSTQCPSTHSAVAAQRTPEHGLSTQVPLAQTCVDGHVTPSHGERGKHPMWQA